MKLQSPNRNFQTSPAVRDSGECSNWYAVCVRARWEQRAARALRGKEYEAFLPLYCKRTRWSDRSKDIGLPLFPGYVFCRGNLAERPPLVTTPGVIGVLSFAGVPAIIPEIEIEAIMALTSSGVYVEPWPYLVQGQRVRVHSGAFAGIEGIFVRTKSDFRVVLSVDALSRSVAVEVSREWVTPLSPVSEA